jgi:hypothetical protein
VIGMLFVAVSIRIEVIAASVEFRPAAGATTRL